MPGRRKKTVDIRELILQMRKSDKDRAVQRDTGMHRQTVKRYRAWAAEQGLLSDAPLPALAALQKLVDATLAEPKPPQNTSSVEPHRALVQQLRKEGTEMAAIYQRLWEGGYRGSYSAVRRFVHNLEPAPKPEVMVRVERRPGEEGQVDFGYAGLMGDPATGQLRRAWAFVMVLAWSRPHTPAVGQGRARRRMVDQQDLSILGPGRPDLKHRPSGRSTCSGQSPVMRPPIPCGEPRGGDDFEFVNVFDESRGNGWSRGPQERTLTRRDGRAFGRQALAPRPRPALGARGLTVPAG